MATNNKEFIQVANQLSVLAKLYFANLSGSPEEIVKKQKEWLRHVKSLHLQLRKKGTKLVAVVKGGKRVPSILEDSEIACPAGMFRCLDGTCVSQPGECGNEGFVGEIQRSSKPGKKTAPAKKNAGENKKK